MILVLNTGSSSLKLSAFADERLLVHAQVDLKARPRFVARKDGAIVYEHEWDRELDHTAAIEWVLGWCQDALAEHRLAAVGHRVVHGGSRFSRPVLIDEANLREMRALVPLAPLHQPHNIAAIEAVARAAPSVPQIACFDTAFHRTQPPVAQAFALPRRFAEEGILRYGFHGISYEYIASVLPSFTARAAAGRTIVLHLGNGASMCALSGGKSVATTMSFTALDGLPMGTRCGSLDPGVVLHFVREGMDAPAIEKLLYEESGLLGVSGTSSDMRELAASQAPEAAEAIELFVYRIGRELGSLAAALGGVDRQRRSPAAIDAIVFTGGIGENQAMIRARVCRAAAWLGVDLDEASNVRGGPRISGAKSRVSAWVIPTNEEAMIALHVRAILHA